MYLRELKQPVSTIRGAGKLITGRLQRLGINSISGLLTHYPRDWEDRSRIVPLADWNKGRVCTEVTILAHDYFGFGRKKTLKIYIEDNTARAALICFNRPFLRNQLIPGLRFRLFGNFIYRYGEIQSSAFELEPVISEDSAESMHPFIPVYPLTEGINQNIMRKLIAEAIRQYVPSLENELPERIIKQNGFLPKPDAMRAIHFPSSIDELEGAKKTLIYEELFYLEILVGQRSLERKKASSSILPENLSQKNLPHEVSAQGDLSSLQSRLLERLPFSLTPGQEASVREINRDMENTYSMARLLQGDVGSGKTLVSFLAALRSIEKGGQAALMAPTELLARQHAENAARLLEPLGIRIAFLTGNLKAAGRTQLLKALSEGEVDLIAGTHALFSRDVIYKNLSLVVVDEQHRFGVLQRQAIMSKGVSEGRVPDLLMMSATPIPRSLALTVFGDLDVTVIKDMPLGRKPVKTHLAKQGNAGKVYDFVKRELSQGRQAYFVYPLIENEDDVMNDGELKDAVSMAEKLSKEVFPGFPLALIHSKVDEEKKRSIMDSFRKGEIKILAATSVVEVGVDVPNATCMVIEHAERFGLAALHQLRGRVGRGSEQSYCFLVYSDAEDASKLTEDGKTRLKIMLENSDGFVIAEEDLKLRGPGHIAGLEQSGYLKLGIADPVRDASVLIQARDEAFSLLDKDPVLQQPENRCIAEVLERVPPFGEL